MNFESELKKGNFFLSECNNCKKIVWPPSEFCDQCLKEVSWKKSSGVGKILEFSKHGEKIFCIAEIDNAIRLIGQIISGKPNVGKRVIISNCYIDKENYIIKMRILD